MSIKKNNSKKTGLIASTIIHLIVFILLTLPFMSLTYLDPPKQRAGGISLNLGESDDFSQSIDNDEEQKKNNEEQKKSNNTNQKKTDSSNNNTNSENNKNSNKNTNGPKDHLVDNNSSNPSADKSTYDDLYAKAQDKKNTKEEKNSEQKEEENEEEKEKGLRENGESSIGEIRFSNGEYRSAIKRVSPPGGTEVGKIHVTIYVDSNGEVISADINLDKKNITDPDMQAECIKAARKTKFDPSNETEDPQRAEIEYNFDVKKD